MGTSTRYQVQVETPEGWPTVWSGTDKAKAARLADDKFEAHRGRIAVRLVTVTESRTYSMREATR